MQSNSQYSGIHPALTSFADECCATLARLIAYVGALALFGIVALYFWDQLQFVTVAEPADQPSFILAQRSRPAFAVSSLEIPEKSEVYEIFRHPEGGRKDIFHWGSPGEKPVAELEIYRPGGEFDPSEPPTADLAARLAPEALQDGQPALETAGVIDSKFGTVALLRRPGRFDAAKSCLGFIRRFGDPALQISGWSCQGTTLAARQSAIGCMLDRLTLLASGNEPKLAELFARADLKRGGCGPAKAVSVDWVTGAENPRLRGTL
ncbi:MAG: hypothetical protein ABSG88_03065 [Bradyrhizobium sp.]